MQTQPQTPKQKAAAAAQDAFKKMADPKPGADGKGPAFPLSDTNPDGFPPPGDERKRRMKDGDRKGVGRKDSEGTANIVDYDVIREALPQLTQITKHAAVVAIERDELYAKTAEAAGCNVPQLKKYVSVQLAGTAKDVTRKLGQQLEMFEKLGEISDTGETKQ